MNEGIEEYPDLELLLQHTIQNRVEDSRFLWCTPGIKFDTHIGGREGVLLGGAFGPGFLEKPWLKMAQGTYVLALPKGNPLPKVSLWIPLLEEISQQEKGVLVIADEIDEEVLALLSINSARGTISCCVVRTNGPTNIDPVAPLIMQKILRGEPGGEIVEHLPMFSEVWVRRGASVGFIPLTARASSEEDLMWPLSSISIVHVGGGDRDDQGRRVEFLQRAISDEDARQGW